MRNLFRALHIFLAQWDIPTEGVKVTITFPDNHTAQYAWQGLKLEMAPQHEAISIDHDADMRGTVLGVPLEFAHPEEKPNPRCDARPRAKI